MKNNPMMKSKERVAKHGEVFTADKEVNAMLDLVMDETRRLDSRFFDPACGTGNFLAEVLRRKLVVARRLCHDNPSDYFRYSVAAVSTVYGVDVMEDNIEDCRERLFRMLTETYTSSLEPEASKDVSEVAQFILEQNIVCADALTGTRVDGQPITLSTWSFEQCRLEPRVSRLKECNSGLISQMAFDVIVGNPPYQLSDGGAQRSAVPIYHKFIERAKQMNPRYLTMIVPARWYSGGKGMRHFREEMLCDSRIAEIDDFPETADVFPGVNIRGGICYFLWVRDHRGGCRVVNHRGGRVVDERVRPLLEEGATAFIRYNRAIDILRKVQAKGETTMDTLVSARKPFGLTTNYRDFTRQRTDRKKILLHRFRGNGYISETDIVRNRAWVDKYKVFEPYASPGADDYPHLVLSRPVVAGPNTACTETYLVVGPFDDEETASYVASYMKTRFFRFLLLLLKSTQHITRKVYAFVPVQDFTIKWTDEMLYAKYGITTQEEEFINSLVRPLK